MIPLSHHQVLMAGGGGNDPVLFGNVRLLLPFDDGDGVADEVDGSDNYTDYSSNGYTITNAGNVEIDTALSYFGTTGDASALFSSSGTNGSLQATIAAFNPRTDPFCIELNIRLTSTGAGWCAMSGGASTNDFWFMGNVSATGNVEFGSGATQVELRLGGYGFATNTWAHIALSFDGTTYRYWVNGVLEGSSTTLLPSISVTQVRIAERIAFTAVDGNFDNYRFVVGQPVYVVPFTPPTAPHPTS